MEVDMECNFCPGFEIYSNFRYCLLDSTLSECGLFCGIFDWFLYQGQDIKHQNVFVLEQYLNMFHIFLNFHNLLKKD